MLLSLVSALAAVVVHDPTGCVDDERLDNELALLLPAPGAVDITVFVDADGESRHTRTEAHRRGQLVWTGRLEALDADCPALPEALALTVKTGLSSLPGWSWDQAPDARFTLGVGVRADVGRKELRPGLSASLEGRVWRGVGLWVDAQGFYSTTIAIGTGSATVTGLSVGGGVQVEHEALRVWAGWSTGRQWAIGRGFDVNFTPELPQNPARLGLSWTFGQVLETALHTRIPSRRILLTTEDAFYREDLFQPGISIRIRRRLQKSRSAGDGGPDGRAWTGG